MQTLEILKTRRLVWLQCALFAGVPQKRKLDLYGLNANVLARFFATLSLNLLTRCEKVMKCSASLAFNVFPNSLNKFSF